MLYTNFCPEPQANPHSCGNSEVFKNPKIFGRLACTYCCSLEPHGLPHPHSNIHHWYKQIALQRNRAFLLHLWTGPTVSIFLTCVWFDSSRLTSVVYVGDFQRYKWQSCNSHWKSMGIRGLTTIRAFGNLHLFATMFPTYQKSHECSLQNCSPLFFQPRLKISPTVYRCNLFKSHNLCRSIK